MKQLKTFTLDDVRKLGPCYDPDKWGEESNRYTILDVLRNTNIPFEDKLWLTLRTDFISERTMRLFSVWSYRQTLVFVPNPDPRSVACADISEKYANGFASKEDLLAARFAAEAAAQSAAWSAAEAAAQSAIESAWFAARSAAWSAAQSAARFAAEAAARFAQNKKLIEMVLDGVETGDTVLE